MGGIHVGRREGGQEGEGRFRHGYVLSRGP